MPENTQNIEKENTEKHDTKQTEIVLHSKKSLFYKIPLDPKLYCRINKRRLVRPYTKRDFVQMPWIPDLSVTIPLAVGTAVKLMPMIQHILMNGRCM